MWRAFAVLMVSVLVVGWLGVTGAAPVSPGGQNNDTTPASPAERGDYFISADTVIIGCTAGAAAGIFAAGIPLVNALRTGVGIPEGFSLLGYLTWMGCTVGAASGVVAVITAWLLPSHH